MTPQFRFLKLLFHFGPGGLRVPCVVACAIRSLAIVITIVQFFFIKINKNYLKKIYFFAYIF